MLPSLRTAPLLSFRTSPQTGVGIRSPVPAPAGAATPFYVLPPAGYFCHQRQKYPKTPLETTFQDFLSALCPAPNFPYVPRVIAFPVYRCLSKGLCHHSFPLSLRCRCLLPRQPLPPLPPYRGSETRDADSHVAPLLGMTIQEGFCLLSLQTTLDVPVIASQCSHWRGNPFSPRPPRNPFFTCCLRRGTFVSSDKSTQKRRLKLRFKTSSARCAMCQTRPMFLA